MQRSKIGVLILCCIINVSNSTIWLYTEQLITALSHKRLSEGAAPYPWPEVCLHGGATIGCFISWLPICYLGHKITLQVVSSLLQTTGACLVTAFFWVHNTYLLLAGTCLVGTAIGLCFVAVPACVINITYVECSTAKKSSCHSGTALVLSTQLSPAVGNLVATTVHTSLGTPLYLAPLCGTIIATLGFCFVTDPPKWFNSANQLNQRCKKVLSQQSNEETGIAVKLLTFLRALCLATCLLCLSDFAGMEVCNFYSDWVLKFAGLDKQVLPSSVLGNALLRVFIVSLTLVLMTYCNGRCLESICLIFSSGMVSLSLFSMGLCLFGLEHGENWTWAVPWIPLSAFLTFQTAFWLGIGTLAQVVTFTYTAASLRPLILSFSGSVHFLLQLMEKNFLLQMIDALHPFGTFWFYAGTSAIGLVLNVFLIVPEIYKLKGMLQNDSRAFIKTRDEISMTEI